ncbi:MAG: four helix bundle protein [Bacteroidales bacterium]|nr:four helix bundle protein [Bacteroidales bacterium]
MAKFEKFEEIEAWKKARKLSKNIYLQTRKESFQNDFALTNQIRKSSGSIMDNIAEGFDRGGNKEFIQFLYIAKGSASETKSQLYRALDQSYIQNEEFEVLYTLVNEITLMLGKLISYLRNSGYKGSKYK